MDAANGLIAVWLDVPADREEEFNAWYDLEHLAQVVALPGFTSARRYRCDDAPLKYLAWYDTANEKVETGPHFQRLIAEPTPWSRRMRKFYGDRRERFNFKLMRDVGKAPERDTPGSISCTPISRIISSPNTTSGTTRSTCRAS